MLGMMVVTDTKHLSFSSTILHGFGVLLEGQPGGMRRVAQIRYTPNPFAIFVS